MKKLLIIVSISLIVYACGSQDSGTPKTQDTLATAPVKDEPVVKDVTEDPDYIAGLELLPKYDCLTCHKVEEKLIGPSYRDVANKYTSDEATIEMLAGKVIKGGAGVWGQIPMTAHPALPKEDAVKMIKYILLLKK